MTYLIGYLQRLTTSYQGTVGYLHFPWASYLSLELPWRGNIPLYSCIPPGSYKVRWTKSPRLRKFTYEILSVPKRAGIRIHAGNYAGAVDRGFLSHSLGCPLLGRKLSTVPQLSVLRSRDAVLEMESILAGQPWTLEVTDEFDSKSL